MAYAHLFYGDYRRSENPLAFLTHLETTLVNLPHLSESEKCHRFYLNCKSDSDAEEWYENLESNSPAVVASWPTLVSHFRVKWLGASPNTLLEPVTTTKTDTATPVACETPTTTTTTATPTLTTNTAIPAIHEITATPEQLGRVTDTCHVIRTSTPTSTQLEPETTTTAAHSITAVEQQGNEELAVERDEEQEGTRMNQDEVRDPTSSPTARLAFDAMPHKPARFIGAGMTQDEVRDPTSSPTARLAFDAMPHEPAQFIGAGMTQDEVRDPASSPTARLAFDAMLHEPARFDWAAEVDEALGLSPVAHNAPQPEPANPAHDDVDVDPNRTACTSAAPVDPILVNPIPGDVADPICIAFANPVPSNSSTTPSVHPDPTIASIHLAPATPTLINPDPGDVAVDPTSTVLTSTVPNDHIFVDPDPAGTVPTNSMPVDPAAIFPVNPDPVDPEPTMLINTVRAALTSVVLTNPVPNSPHDVAADPVRTALASVMPTNPVLVELIPADPVSIDSIPTDLNPVVRVSPIHIVPTEPVHIDPVSSMFRAFISNVRKMYSFTLLLLLLRGHGHPFYQGFIFHLLRARES